MYSPVLTNLQQMGLTRSISWIVFFLVGLNVFFDFIQARHGLSAGISRLIQAALEVFVLSVLFARSSSADQSTTQQEGASAVDDNVSHSFAGCSFTDNESRLREVQQLAQIGDWEYELATGRINWSAELFRMFGRDSDQPAPTFEEFFQQVHPGDREILEGLVKQSIVQGSSFSLDHRIIRQDDEIRYVSCRGEAIHNSAGEVIRLAGTLWDITDRKKLELELQTSEDKLKQTLNAAKASIISYRMYRDRHWDYLYVSPGSEVILGYAAEELMADQSLWVSRVVSEDWETVFLPILDDIFDECQVSLEYRFRHKDDTIRWISTELASCYDAATDTWIVTLVDVDISDRKAAEIALENSERRLQAILDSSPYGIFLKDRQGCYTYVNPAYERLSQISATDLLGKSSYDILPQSFAATCEISDQAALAADTPIVFEETVLWERGTQTLLITKFALKEVFGDRPDAVCGIVLDITERKAAVLALKQSQQQYQALVDSVESIVWELDPETFQFTFVSPQAEEILGYAVSEWLEPDFWADHVFPEDLEFAYSYCRNSVETGQDHQFEYRMIAADGRIVWIQDIVRLVYEEGQLTKMVGLLLDITERKQAETALWESRQLLQRIFDNVPQAIFWKDRQSTYLGCNQLFANYAGLQSPEDVIGKTDYELPWLPEETESYLRTDREVMESAQDQLHIIDQQHPANGDELWVETSKVPLEDAAGEVVGVLGTYEDITQRKIIEEALHYSEARFRAVFEQSSVGIALINETGQFLQVNAAYAAITGYSSEALLQVGFHMVTYPDDQEQSRRGIESLLSGEQGSLSIEKRYLCKNGELRWVNLSLCPMLVRNGKTLNFLTAMVVDITARKQAEQELIKRAEQEGAFHRVVQIIRSSLDLNTIFSVAVREVSTLLECERIAIVQYQAERQCWSRLIEHRSSPDLPDRTGLDILDADNPFAERLKRFEVVQTHSTDEITDPINRAIAQVIPGARLLVPLIVNEQPWGSLSFLKAPTMTPFSEDEVALARRVADQLAIAIQQSTLYTQLQEANQQLHHLATHDPLTQLANRRYFNDYLSREWSRLARNSEGTWFSLIICDIDHFKLYNDFYGHLQGDDCLVQVAQALSRGIKRPTDIVARYGGEEFAFVLPETNDAGAIHVVHKIQSEIAELELPHSRSPVNNYITASFGIACFHKRSPILDQTFTALFQTADEALYRAKRSGRNRYEIVIV